MPDWYQAKKEILVALYCYQMLTSQQLAILLGYKRSSMYRVGKSLQKQEAIHSLFLPFLPGHSKGYVLTASGAKAASYLYGEADTHVPRLYEEVPSQLEHLYGTNQFFIDLIAGSLQKPGEGLVEWLGTRDAADRYAKFEGPPGKKKLPLKPDGLCTYRFADGRRLMLHLEYDTGSENLWRLQDKLWNYGVLLPQVWQQVERVHVLILTKGKSRAGHIMRLWEALRMGPLAGHRLPSVWCSYEEAVWNKGMNSKWLGAGGSWIPLEQMATLPDNPQGDVVFLGKQLRSHLFQR
ncbi:replication-relaxation family protein [Effusibacillus consociatus]|uniref:Replication-relaxation family protein n=1 Tax=Effusibacillus consociatus TaxID=1117041 RepID=A0ABV9Q048_9BACL